MSQHFPQSSSAVTSSLSESTRPSNRGCAVSIQRFFPMQVPTVTHNDLKVVPKRNSSGKLVAGIIKSERLHKAEDDYISRLVNFVAGLEDDVRDMLPISEPCILDITWCFPFDVDKSEHWQGEPMAQKPDLDNMNKTFQDCLTRAGIISDDSVVCDLHNAKVWSNPSGVYFLVRPISSHLVLSGLS